MQRIPVGIAEIVITNNLAVLVTIVGSCVAVSLRDPVAKVGGMAHIMLPKIDQSRNRENPEKFADSGIELAVEIMLRKGCSKSRIEAKIAGGANMFHLSTMKIGDRNVVAVIQKLKELIIPILAQDTGGDYGRTVEFHIETGEMIIKTAFKGVKKL